MLLKVDVLASEGETLSVPGALFDYPFRADVVRDVLEWQMARARSGTRSTKGVSDISGTGAKPFRQKGTGRARQGSLRSPQFRGGAVIFGPVVRSHAFKINKKVRALALKIMLSYKFRQDSFFVINPIEYGSFIKTKAFFGLFGLCSGFF